MKIDKQLTDILRKEGLELYSFRLEDNKEQIRIGYERRRGLFTHELEYLAEIKFKPRSSSKKEIPFAIMPMPTKDPDSQKRLNSLCSRIFREYGIPGRMDYFKTP